MQQDSLRLSNELLIELVREKPQLWNTMERGYRNVELAARNWEEIAEEVGIDVETAKKRWRSLRDRFVKEVRGKNKMTGSGARREAQWSLLESLMFLKPTITPRTFVLAVSSAQPLPSVPKSELITSSSMESQCDTRIASSWSIKRKRSQDGDELERLSTTPQEYSPNELFFLSIAKNIDGANLSLSSQLYVQSKTLEALRDATEGDGKNGELLNFTRGEIDKKTGRRAEKESKTPPKS